MLASLILSTISFSPSLASPQTNAQAIKGSCTKGELGIPCLIDALVLQTQKSSLENAFATLKEIQKTDAVANDCHFIAHNIAIAEVDKNPTKWREVLNNRCPSNCSYGCAHGALEAHANATKSGLTVSDLVQACDQNSPPACPHAIGHLLLVYSKNNLNQAVTACHNLTNIKDVVYQCVTGVFMENSNPINLLDHGLIPPPLPKAVNRIPELETLCRQFTGIDALSCWQELAPAILQKNNFDPRALLYCDGLTDPNFTRECQIRMLDTLAWELRYDLGSIGKACLVKDDPSFQDICYAQLAISTLESVPQNIAQVVAFCKQIGSEFQRDCFAVVGSNFKRRSDLDQNLLKNACKLAPSKWQSTCIAGGEVNLKPFLSTP